MKIKVGGGNIRIEEFAELCGGVLCANFDVEEFGFSHVCTDSREADADTLFVVMKGERVDGHDYMESAWERGCRAFLCQRIPEAFVANEYEFAVITCEESVTALGNFVRAYYEFRQKKTVAVTGSVGKTTTKEMISAVLGEKFRLHKTDGNHNSTIGMPMSLLAMEPSDELMVAEMGMGGFGEISFMSRIACPDIACITNIGSSHLEALGSRENIALAKLEIAEGLSKDGVLILNGDEPLLASVPAGIKTIYVSVDNPEGDYRAVNIRHLENGPVFDLARGGEIMSDIQLPCVGKPYVWAALFAVAVGERLGMDAESIKRGLMNFKRADMRQNIECFKGITVIEDCYNAAPESMRAAADVMKLLSDSHGGARTVALLGDMRELGENSREYHKEVGRYFASLGLSRLFCVGELAVDIARGALDAGMENNAVTIYTDHDDTEKISDIVSCELQENDILLVKASRAIGAEKILKLIKEKM